MTLKGGEKQPPICKEVYLHYISTNYNWESVVRILARLHNIIIGIFGNKQGHLIKEGQTIGFVDQFGTELPMKVSL